MVLLVPIFIFTHLLDYTIISLLSCLNITKNIKMHITVFTTVVFGLALSTPSLGKGINCKGSTMCHGAGSNGESIQNIFNSVNGQGDSILYTNGQHLACDAEGTGLCAYYQKRPGGGTAGEAKGFLQRLIDHGCDVCGSVPTQPG